MKEKLRKMLIKRRKNLSKTEVLENSKKIEKKLFEINEFKQASTILFYVSYDNEVYTHDIIKKCLKKDKNVVVPIVNKEKKSLTLSKLELWSNLESAAYNILEPKKECIKEIPADKIDMIIIPGVGFDEQGRRIGHGKGYYDKLLKDSKHSNHIGLAFEMQIVEKIPSEKHDIPVETIVTEKRVINCKKN